MSPILSRFRNTKGENKSALPYFGEHLMVEIFITGSLIRQDTG